MNIQEYKQNYSPIIQPKIVEEIIDCKSWDNKVSFWCEAPDDFVRFLHGYDLEKNTKNNSSGTSLSSPSQGF